MVKKFYGLFWIFFEKFWKKNFSAYYSFFLNFLKILRKKFFGLFPHEIFFGKFFQQKCHSEKIFRPILNLIENINFRENLNWVLAYQIWDSSTLSWCIWDFKKILSRKMVKIGQKFFIFAIPLFWGLGGKFYLLPR